MVWNDGEDEKDGWITTYTTFHPYSSIPLTPPPPLPYWHTPEIDTTHFMPHNLARNGKGPKEDLPDTLFNKEARYRASRRQSCESASNLMKGTEWWAIATRKAIMVLAADILNTTKSRKRVAPSTFRGAGLPSPTAGGVQNSHDTQSIRLTCVVKEKCKEKYDNVCKDRHGVVFLLLAGVRKKRITRAEVNDSVPTYICFHEVRK